MKRTFLSLATMLLTLCGHAQNDSTVLGMSELHVKYQVAQLCGYPNQWRKDNWRDTLTYELDVCGNVARWQQDDWTSKLENGWKYFQQNKKIWPLSLNTPAILGEVVIGMPEKGKLTRRVIMDVAGLMQYSEAFPQMKWKVQPEHKEILDYDCQRATCEFRGRKWEAWFTADIPVSYGPYKFGGLPGLILDLEDSTHEWHFTAQELGRPTTSQPIIYRHYEAATMDHKRLMNKEKLLNLNHTAFAQDYGAKIALDGMEIGKMPYYPLELK